MRIKIIPTNFIIICICIIGILINSSFNVSIDNYESNMATAIHKLNVAKTEIEFKSAASDFDKISVNNKTNWLPYYYSSLSKILIIIELGSKKADLICDEAILQIKKCDSLSPNNSEVYVLLSMYNSAKLSINPKLRAAKHSKLIFQNYEKALSLDKMNPRAYLQKAQYVYHTPEALGGGIRKALPVFEEALLKFKTYKPKSKIDPNWGEAIAEKMILKCKSELNKK